MINKFWWEQYVPLAYKIVLIIIDQWLNFVIRPNTQCKNVHHPISNTGPYLFKILLGRITKANKSSYVQIHKKHMTLYGETAMFKLVLLFHLFIICPYLNTWISLTNNVSLRNNKAKCNSNINILVILNFTVYFVFILKHRHTNEHNQ